MCTWRIAANPKSAIFPPSVLLFVCLHWLSCPHLFVSRSEGVPTRRGLRSWGREASREETAHLSPGCAGVTPQPRRGAGHSPALPALPASSRPRREGMPGWREDHRRSAGGRLSGPAPDPVPQPRSEPAERSKAGQSCCQPGGQAHAGYVPYLCKRCCNGSSCLGSSRRSV